VEALTRVRVAFEVSEPGQPLRVVESDADVIKIGSLETAQVRLAAPGVARMHAVVECTGDGCSVIDLGGKPTRVNGEAVTRRELSNGDALSIGDAELRVRIYG
jgi:pSer/pThr/pTyr-binding forkhead associated (FHA) protein